MLLMIPILTMFYIRIYRVQCVFELYDAYLNSNTQVSMTNTGPTLGGSRVTYLPPLMRSSADYNVEMITTKEKPLQVSHSSTTVQQPSNKTSLENGGTQRPARRVPIITSKAISYASNDNSSSRTEEGYEVRSNRLHSQVYDNTQELGHLTSATVTQHTGDSRKGQIVSQSHATVPSHSAGSSSSIQESIDKGSEDDYECNPSVRGSREVPKNEILRPAFAARVELVNTLMSSQ